MRTRVQRGGRLLAALLAVLAGLGAPARGHGKERPAPVKITPQLLDALGREYLDAGLPLPPPDAPLTVAPSGSIQGLPDGRHRDLYMVGFLTVPPPVVSSGEVGTLLMGTREVEARATAEAVGGIPARRLAAGDGLPTGVPWLKNEEYYGTAYPVNSWLLLAVQCHLRGYERAARDIFARGLTRDDPTASRFTPLGDGGPRDALAASAWNHWMNTQCEPAGDRRAVLARLEKLAAEFPASLTGEFQRDYLASLRLTLASGPGASGGDEALVDALVEHASNPNFGHADTEDPGYNELLLDGFAAVPALLAHLDDRRLTRSTGPGVDGVYHPRRVGEIAGGLLAAIAGEGVLSGDAFNPSPDWSGLDLAQALLWWAGAAALGEEAYMATQGGAMPSGVSLQILSARYPGRLAEVYARTLADPAGDGSYAVAQAISECPRLPHAERCRLLRVGADSPRLERCIEALTVLSGFDQTAADAALLACLGRWPTEASVPYNLQPPEVRISELLLGTDSAEVWQAYERALFRAGVDLRMAMLARLSETSGNSAPQVRQMALLDLFLDDPEVRVVRPEDQKPGGRYEGQKFSPEERRMRVGDYVAGLLDRMLELKPPAGSVHDERWQARHRAAAREAIDRHAREGLQAPVELP